MTEQPFWESEAYKANPDFYRYGVVHQVGLGSWVDWYVPRDLGRTDTSRDLWVKREVTPPTPFWFD